MPPKADPAAISISENDAIALCHIMAQADEFKVNTAKLAPYLNIEYSKNVPRKINGIINKLGFEYKDGKIVAKDGDQSIPATPKTPTGAAKTDPDGNEAPQTPAPKKKATATPKTPASKKRKVKAIEQEDDGHDAIIKDENVNGDAVTKVKEENGSDK